MSKIYSVLGGGSTYVCEALRKKFGSKNCACRVDKFFVAPDESQVLDDKSFLNAKKAQKYKNHQVVASFKEQPKQSVVDSIKKRTNFAMDPKISIHKNFSALIASKPKYFVLVRAPQFGFLSTNKIKSIAVLRHPLIGYVGLSRRHPEFYVNKLQTEEKVRWYAGVWNRSVSDFLNSNSIILRYEFLKHDLEKYSTQIDTSIFNGWHPSLRPSCLRKPLEELMLELVKDQYFQIHKEWQLYENWHIDPPG